MFALSQDDSQNSQELLKKPESAPEPTRVSEYSETAGPQELPPVEAYLDDGRLAGAGVMISHHHQQIHSGPIPDPGSLQGYEQVLPGAADRIMRMAEEDAKSIRDTRLIKAKEGTKALEVIDGSNQRDHKLRVYKLIGALVGAFLLFLLLAALLFASIGIAILSRLNDWPNDVFHLALITGGLSTIVPAIGGVMGYVRMNRKDKQAQELASEFKGLLNDLTQPSSPSDSPEP